MFPIRTATSRTVAGSLQNNQIQAMENEKTSLVEQPGEWDWQIVRLSDGQIVQVGEVAAVSESLEAIEKLRN